MVPMRHSAGHLLGILSVDEPRSGRKPTDEDLDVLVALADHAALAVQAAQEEAEAARHKRALEQLLAVSSRLTVEPGSDRMLRRVCAAIREALGFQNVCAALVEPDTQRVTPHAAEQRVPRRRVAVHDRDLEVVPLGPVEVDRDRAVTERLADCACDRAEHLRQLLLRAEEPRDLEEASKR